MSRMRAQRMMTAATGRSQTLASLMTMTATCALFPLPLASPLSFVSQLFHGRASSAVTGKSWMQRASK